jgi:hypothetical protein
MDGGKREVFDIRALTVPPLCRYVLMVAWSGVEVNYLRGSTAWGLAGPFVAASRGNAGVTTKMGVWSPARRGASGRPPPPTAT